MAMWRILVADDDPLSLQVMRDSLANLPATILEARDGEEAIRLAKSEDPDLILLDVMMPRLDGFQVAALLKKDPATVEIPVIFVSALGAPKDKVRGLNLGAEDYLAKPMHPEELQARVQMVLRRIQPSRRDVPMASGQLAAMNLPSLIQMLEGERRTARLLLTHGDARGEIVFEEGKITRASQGNRKGNAALYQLLTWPGGTFQMAPPDASSQAGGTVDAPIQALLLEGKRRLDETPGLQAGLGDPSTRMDVPAPLRAAIQGQARPEAVAVLALLDGTCNLDQILAQSPVDDWATLKILDSLRRSRALGPADVGHERRGGPRLYVEVPIEYQTLGSFQRSAAFNLTAQGVFIRTAVPFEMGEQVVLRFLLPGQETPVNVIGQVVWRNADPSKTEGTGMGIRFVEVAAADREAIEHHLAQAIAIQVSGVEERQ
ncbi:MAG: TIGR02266 family protein [Candidatus Methylomirabilales bacterium]